MPHPVFPLLSTTPSSVATRTRTSAKPLSCPLKTFNLCCFEHMSAAGTSWASITPSSAAVHAFERGNTDYTLFKLICFLQLVPAGHLLPLLPRPRAPGDAAPRAVAVWRRHHTPHQGGHPRPLRAAAIHLHAVQVSGGCIQYSVCDCSWGPLCIVSLHQHAVQVGGGCIYCSVCGCSWGALCIVSLHLHAAQMSGAADHLCHVKGCGFVAVQFDAVSQHPAGLQPW